MPKPTEFSTQRRATAGSQPSRRLSLRSTLISHIASEPRWWQDGPPHWMLAKGRQWEKPCETALIADERRERYVRLLPLYADEVADALAVAAKLEACSAENPCTSGACPCCARAFQRWFVFAGQRLLKTALSNRGMTMCTAVPDYGRVPLARLHDFDLEACNRQFVRDLARHRVMTSFGGVDLSINPVVGHDSDPIVQVQFTTFIAPCSRTDIEGLRASLNRTKVINRPLMCKPFDGRRPGLAYGMKPNFIVRETYVDGQSVAGRDPHLNTRNRPLRGIRWAKVMTFVDRVALNRRLVLHGVRSAHFNGKLRLRLTE